MTSSKGKPKKQGHKLMATILSNITDIQNIFDNDDLQGDVAVYLSCGGVVGWWHGTVVERRSLAGELSLSCARPAADG